MKVEIRTDEFRAMQRENVQVAAELRKALASVCLVKAPSPVEGGFSELPSPSGGTLVPLRVGIAPTVLGTGSVLDRRNSRLRW
jgi:hypothetical protein